VLAWRTYVINSGLSTVDGARKAARANAGEFDAWRAEKLYGRNKPDLVYR
jgi:hypothetical protein